MNKEQLELYTDYLMVTFGYATATGLLNLLDGEISHNTRLSSFLTNYKELGIQ